MTFWQKLNKFRRPGEGDTAFAKRMGMGAKCSLVQWRRREEQGGRCAPLIATCQRIAKNLGVDWEYFYYDDDSSWG